MKKILMGVCGSCMLLGTMWLSQGIWRPTRTIRIFVNGTVAERQAWAENWTQKAQQLKFVATGSPEGADLLMGDGAWMATQAHSGRLLPLPHLKNPVSVQKWKGQSVALALGSTGALQFLKKGTAAKSGILPFKDLENLLELRRARGISMVSLPTHDGRLGVALLVAGGALKLSGESSSPELFHSVTFDANAALKAFARLHTAAFIDGFLPQNCEAECARSLWKEGRAEAIIGRPGLIEGLKSADQKMQAFAQNVPADQWLVGLSTSAHPDLRQPLWEFLMQEGTTPAGGVVCPELDRTLAYHALEEHVGQALGALFRGRLTPEQAVEDLKQQMTVFASK